MTIIKKSTNNKCWRRCGEKETLLRCWWKCKLVQPLWKTVWRCLRKLKIEFPYDPAIPLLWIYLDGSINQKDTHTPMFIAALFTIAKTWKQPKCPSTEEWIKIWYVCMGVCAYIWYLCKYHREIPHNGILLLLLSHFSHVRLCATPETAAHQALPSLGFSRKEHWSGWPFPSPMHESEKWKWSCSVVPDS